MTDHRTNLADAVRELTDPYAVTQELPLRNATPDGRPAQKLQVRRAVFPSLLDQLRAAVEPSTSGRAAGYESSPVASLEAVDLLTAIARGSALMLWSVGRERRTGIKTRLRALVGLNYAAELRRGHVDTVHGWVTQALLVTRWDLPAVRLRGTCSRCGARGTVKVRVDPLSAACGDCGATWTGDAEMAILGAHIRWCNGETEPATQDVAA